MYEGASISPATSVIQDFSSPVTYTVTAQDGSIKAYVVTVSFGEQTDFAVYFAKNADDATGTMRPQLIKKNTSAALKANAFARSGYAFMGWATSPSGSAAYADGASFAMASEEVVLYAVWHPLQGLSASLRVTPGGDIAISGDLSAARGQTMSFSFPAGYTALAWLIDGEELMGETGRTLVLDTGDYLLGVHRIHVVVLDDAEGEAYSGSFSFVIHN